MAKQTDQQTRDEEPLEEFTGGGLDDLEDRLGEESDTQSSPGIRDRIRSRLSIRSLVVTALALGVPAAIASSFVPLIGGPLGLVGGAFLLGAVAPSRSYTEVGSVGAILGAFGALAGDLTFAVAADAIITLAVVGALAGSVIAVLGLYFGRDLRDGLTREI